MANGKTVVGILSVEEYMNRKLYNESDLAIATDLFIGTETLRCWKRLQGITNHMVDKHKYKLICQLKEQGLSTYKISGIMNLHRKTVNRIYYKFNKK